MRRVRFRQADLQRALRAAKAEGIAIDRIVIEPSTGKIIVHTSGVEPTKGKFSLSGPLDDWLAKNARAS